MILKYVAFAYDPETDTCTALARTYGACSAKPAIGEKAALSGYRRNDDALLAIVLDVINRPKSGSYAELYIAADVILRVSQDEISHLIPSQWLPYDGNYDFRALVEGAKASVEGPASPPIETVG